MTLMSQGKWRSQCMPALALLNALCMLFSKVWSSSILYDFAKQYSEITSMANPEYALLTVTGCPEFACVFSASVKLSTVFRISGSSLRVEACEKNLDMYARRMRWSLMRDEVSFDCSITRSTILTYLMSNRKYGSAWHSTSLTVKPRLFATGSACWVSIDRSDLTATRHHHRQRDCELTESE